MKEKLKEVKEILAKISFEKLEIQIFKKAIVIFPITKNEVYLNGIEINMEDLGMSLNNFLKLLKNDGIKFEAIEEIR